MDMKTSDELYDMAIWDLFTEDMEKALPKWRTVSIGTFIEHFNAGTLPDIDDKMLGKILGALLPMGIVIENGKLVDRFEY